MEVMPVPRQTFMPEIKRKEPAVRDSTIVMKQKTCRRLYFFTAVCGFRPRGKSIHYLAFGGAYHVFREVLEKKWNETGNEQAALQEALKACMAYWIKYGSEPVVGTKFDMLTGRRLMASCEKAFLHWKREKEMEKIEVLHGLIEGPTMITLSDKKTKIGARFDQITRWSGRLMPRDFKSTSKNKKWYERELEPNDQFTRQSLIAWRLASELPFCTSVELLYNTKKEGPEIVPLTTARTEEQLLKFEEGEIYLAEELAQCREKDMWPMEEKHCKYCEFRLVCRAPTERAAMAQLNAGFEQRTWDFTAADVNADPEDAEELE